MLERVIKRFLRGLVAVVLPVIITYVAEQLGILSQDLPPEYGAFLAPLLLALGKWLREQGAKWTPV